MPRTMLESWHDFFTLVGASAATLVGLMFVAASVGTGLFTGEKEIGLRTFLSPTVVAFGVVLASCVVGVLPSPNSIVPQCAAGRGSSPSSQTSIALRMIRASDSPDTCAAWASRSLSSSGRYTVVFTI